MRQTTNPTENPNDMTMSPHPINLSEIAARYAAATERMELAWALYRQSRHDNQHESRYLMRYVRRLRIADRIRKKLAQHVKEGTL